jgi:SAM-dependent methyltransferase
VSQQATESVSAIRQQENCRLCHLPVLVRVVELAPVPVLTANIVGQKCPPHMEMAPLNLYRCGSCGHLQLKEYVDPELQYRNFNYRTASSSGLVEHFEELASDVWWRIGGDAATFVVDIGSNDGTLLRAFQKKGACVLGIEPGFAVAQEAQESGIPTLPHFFDRKVAHVIEHQYGLADVILCCNTMANLSDLDGLMEAAKTLMKANGLFVFETQSGADVINRFLIDTIYHEHQSYFLVKPLKSFFERHGLELAFVLPIPTKGGSIRGYVQVPTPGKRQFMGDTVASHIKKEQSYKLEEQSTYDKFSQRLDRMREQLSWALPGGLITAAGFGVSVGSSTLIAQLELETHLEYLVDDNPVIGALPGEYHDLPVYHSDYLYEDKPDRVLILAWRYADQIVAKHQRYLEQGGEFIVPWPEFRIVGKSGDVHPTA